MVIFCWRGGIKDCRTVEEGLTDFAGAEDLVGEVEGDEGCFGAEDGVGEDEV